jgi:hypothetical protein
MFFSGGDEPRRYRLFSGGLKILSYISGGSKSRRYNFLGGLKTLPYSLFFLFWRE